MDYLITILSVPLKLIDYYKSSASMSRQDLLDAVHVIAHWGISTLRKTFGFIRGCEKNVTTGAAYMSM